MLYLSYIISKNLLKIGCKSSSGRFWRIADKSNEKPCYELKDSGDIPAFSIDDIILNEENAKNIWGIREEDWMLKVLQIFNLARMAEDKERTINNFMANEYGYKSETQMNLPEKPKSSSGNYTTSEEFLMALKRATGSFATKVSQKKEQSEDANREDNYQVAFVPKRLEVNGKPEFNHFPINVLFAGTRKEDDDKQRIHYSVYLPDFSTYTEDDKNQGMEYYNKIDRNWWLWISRNKERGSYEGCKYRGRDNKESLGSATGMNYELFFRFFTALGVKK